MVGDAHIGQAHRACKFVQQATYWTQSLRIGHQVKVGVDTPRYARCMALVAITNLCVEIASVKSEEFRSTDLESVLHFIANEDVHVSVHNDGRLATFPCDGCQPRHVKSSTEQPLVLLLENKMFFSEV